MRPKPRAAAKPLPLHTYIPPLDPTPVDAPPIGDDWIHEIKWDGYRAQAHIGDGRITIFSRGGLDWTDRFRAIPSSSSSCPSRAPSSMAKSFISARARKPDPKRGKGKLHRESWLARRNHHR